MTISPNDLPDIEAERVYAVVQNETGYADHHRERLDRLDRLDRVIAGKESVVLPDGTAVDDSHPKNGNSIARDLEDIGKVVGGGEPTVMAKPEKENDTSVGKAAERTKLLAAYRSKNRIRMMRPLKAMDLAGAGMSVVCIWPDQSYINKDKTEDLEKKRHALPRYILENPRACLPDPSWYEGDDLRNMLIPRSIKARTVDAAFPGVIDALFTKHEAKEAQGRDIKVMKWFDSEISLLVATVKMGTEQRARVTVLASLPNLIGTPLVVMGKRPTFDRQFRGQFDDAIEPWKAANQLNVMAQDNIQDEIYSPKVAIGDFENLEDYGPDALIRGQLNASITRVPVSNTLGTTLAWMQFHTEQSRISSGRTQARQGIADQSIISAAGVNALQGMDITNAEDYAAILADMEERENAIALAVEEKYMDMEGKTVSGFVGGQYFNMTYTPSRLIAGNYANQVVYGEGSMMDEHNKTIRIEGLVNGRIRSRRWARKQLPGDVDLLEEERQLAQEAIEDGILAELTSDRMTLEEKYLVATRLEEGKSMLAIVPELQSIREQAQIPEPQAPGVAETQDLARSRGGQPGRAETLRGAPLPALGELVPGGGG